MAGFSNFKEIIEAEEAGRSFYSSWRKTPAQATNLRVWFDLSVSPGNPSPQYYASSPLTAYPMSYSDQGGIYHGGNVSPYYKFLSSVSLFTSSATPLPCPFILCDYLLYYPFIDENSSDVQTMDNTQTLTRYTDGEGVQIMAVSVGGRTGGFPFQVTYTNQDGVSGRVTESVLTNSVSTTGSIINASATAPFGPFLPLQSGDSGVRSIESVQMTGGTDSGLFTLVLVKPLLRATIQELASPVEITPLVTGGLSLPRIYDDAFLSWLILPTSGSLGGTVWQGDIRFVYN